MSTIPLAKGYKPQALEFPVLLSEKLDGMPVCITVRVDSAGIPAEFTMRSRQNENVVSCSTVVNDWFDENQNFFEGFSGIHYIVGEIVQTADKRAPFKDTGGIARRQEDQGPVLSVAVFDYFWDAGDLSYIDRFRYFVDKTIATDFMYPVAFALCTDQDELDYRYKCFTAAQPKAEGMIARSFNDTFEQGKRSWGYQKLLNEPVIDLLIVGCEEAKAADGTPKGMAGRLVAQYNGSTTGVGPGKLTHKERVDVLKYFRKAGATPLMAKIKHKGDESYSKLRQPTFQEWHHGKDKPDA